MDVLSRNNHLTRQQTPLEKAFTSPQVLAERLGRAPTAGDLAGFDEEAVIEVFSRPPALHRFPKAMAVSGA